MKGDPCTDSGVGPRGFKGEPGLPGLPGQYLALLSTVSRFFCVCVFVEVREVLNMWCDSCWFRCDRLLTICVTGAEV